MYEYVYFFHFLLWYFIVALFSPFSHINRFVVVANKMQDDSLILWFVCTDQFMRNFRLWYDKSDINTHIYTHINQKNTIPEKIKETCIEKV